MSSENLKLLESNENDFQISDESVDVQNLETTVNKEKDNSNENNYNLDNHQNGLLEENSINSDQQLSNHDNNGLFCFQYCFNS